MNEATLALNQFPPLSLSTKRMAYGLLGLTYFILPMSSSIKSITLTLFLLLTLLTPAYREAAFRLFQTKWAKAVGVLFVVVVVACLWGPGSLKDKWVSIEKYMKLLYLPFLAMMFHRASARQMAIKMCLAGISFVSMLSILSYFEVFSFLTLTLNSDRVFRNHIVFGFMGAYGAYMAACLACESFHLRPIRQIGFKRSKAGRRHLDFGYIKGSFLRTRFAQVGYTLLVLMLTFQVLWVNGGRMAYVLYLVLAMLWMWHFLSWKNLMFAFWLVGGVFYGIYQYSPTMHARVSWSFSEFEDYKQSKLDTSLGFRVQMHRLAKQLFVAHPVWGNGTGSFRPLSEKTLTPLGFESLRDPHSQYWLVAAEQGSIGLAALLGLFACFFFATYRLKQSGVLAVGLLIAFILSQLTDTMLFYSGPGCFFIMIMAIYLGEAHENSI